MAPLKVTKSNILAIRKRMNETRKRIRIVTTKFRVSQHVRINKENIKFAKVSEQNYTTEIFRIVKIIQRKPRPVYVLQDLKKILFDGQFCMKSSLLLESLNEQLIRYIK
jgi:hypothetical protein